MARIAVNPNSGCWEFQGALRNGYGAVGEGLKVKYVHRITYEHTRGPIPEGLIVDHLCMNRRCCNPDHLEAITRAENNMRALKARGFDITEDQCRYGHPYSEDNTYWHKGGRHCRQCRADRDRERQERRKEVAT